jgi:hypothetical protein
MNMSRIGGPRQFDRHDALQSAMDFSGRKATEGTTLADLKGAIQGTGVQRCC